MESIFVSVRGPCHIFLGGEPCDAEVIRRPNGPLPAIRGQSRLLLWGCGAGSVDVVPPLPFSSRPVFTRSVPSPRDTQALPLTVPCSTLPRGGAP